MKEEYKTRKRQDTRQRQKQGIIIIIITIYYHEQNKEENKAIIISSYYYQRQTKKYSNSSQEESLINGSPAPSSRPVPLLHFTLEPLKHKSVVRMVASNNLALSQLITSELGLLQ